MSDEQTKQKPAHGTFCWNELMTRDTAGSGKFYAELLGWKPEPSGMPGMDYTLMKSGDSESAGMMEMPPDVPKEVPPHWLAYVAVDDVDALTAKTKELGGQVLHGPMDIPEVGRFVVIQDPTGAVLGLITLS